MMDYQQLEKRFRRLGALQEASGVLQWDSAVLMPEGGAGARAEQLATMKVVCHEILTEPAMGDLLDGAAAQNDLDDWQRANLREMRRIWLHATAVPGDLVDAASRAASACEQV
jgi:carboxypeptidase Taq